MTHLTRPRTQKHVGQPSFVESAGVAFQNNSAVAAVAIRIAILFGGYEMKSKRARWCTGLAPWTLAVCACLMALPCTTQAAYMVNAGNNMITENFNSLPTDAVVKDGDDAPLWTDDVTLPNWYLAGGDGRIDIADKTVTNSGAKSIGASSSDADRALGSTGALRLGTSILNNTGATILGATITYTGEQWRKGASVDTLVFEYLITSAAGNQINATGYIAVPALDFAGTQTGSGQLNGTPTTLSAVLDGIHWNDGQYLWLRWSDSNITSNDAMLAIDDLSVSVPEPGSALLLVPSLLLCKRRRTARPVA